MVLIKPIRGLFAALVLLGLASAGRADGQWFDYDYLPEGRSDMAHVVLEDTLFLIGGNIRFNNTLTPSNTVIAYDLANHAWNQQLPAMNNARAGATAAVVNGRVYVFGGRSSDDLYVSQIESWQPGDSSWHVEGQLLPARAGMRAFVQNDSIFITGGAAANLERFSTIDLALPPHTVDDTMQVSALTDTLPVARSYHALVHDDTSTYILGGFYLWPLNDAYRWEGPGGSWQSLDTLDVPRGGMEAVVFHSVYGTSIVVSGGRGESGETGEVRTMTMNGEWTATSQVTPLPFARTNHVMFTYHDSLFVLGGSYESSTGTRELLSDFIRFTPIGTGVDPSPIPLPPGRLTLRAHPNPSNGAVRITVEPFVGSGPVNVRLFNLLGESVAAWTLPPGGARTLTWEGSASGAASGVYFLVARQGREQRTLKLLRLP